MNAATAAVVASTVVAAIATARYQDSDMVACNAVADLCMTSDDDDGGLHFEHNVLATAVVVVVSIAVVA